MKERGMPQKHGGGVQRSDGEHTAPSVSFFQLTEASIVPARWKNANNFSITRLQSPFGIPNRIMKASAVKALLVSVSLRSIPLGRYQLWADAKQLPTSYVPAFRSNIIDFDAGPGCWAGTAFDYVHYHVPREDLDEIAEDWQLGPVCEYKQSVIEDDLVLAQMTKNILPSITMEDRPCSLVLDQFQLVLGAHLLQRYGGIARVKTPAIGGLAIWQKRRALELLRENLDGSVRLGDLAKECGLSVSHFARSFKAAFGELLQKALAAHGGLDQWNRFGTVQATIVTGGQLFGMKGTPQDPTPRRMTVATKREWASVIPYGADDQRTDFTANRIAIEKLDGTIVNERLHPSEHAEGKAVDAPWDVLDRAYFNGYALWTYLTTLFHFVMPGFVVEEIDPWREDDELWPGLRVTYPSDIASHSRQQDFYFGSDFLLRRHDYHVEASGGFAAAQYVFDSVTVEGITLPTKRRAYMRDERLLPIHDRLMVSIDLSDISFS